MWDARLKSLRQEGSSCGRKCYCKATIESMKKFNTPAAPGTVLKKPDKGEEILTPAKQTQYCSGVGKGMHMTQYSWPDMYNAVCNLA